MSGVTMDNQRVPQAGEVVESIEFLQTSARNWSTPMAATSSLAASPGMFAVRLAKAAQIITAQCAEIIELKDERDQFAEQAAMRDQRDADMQEIMRINNDLNAALAAKDAQISHILDDYQYWLDARMGRDKARADKARAETPSA